VAQNPYGHDDFRVGHLIVQVFYQLRFLLINGAGDQKKFGMLRVSGVDDTESFDVVQRCKASQHFNIAPVATDCVVT